MMAADQAEKVDMFLNGVIADGKAADVEEGEELEAENEQKVLVVKAAEIIREAEEIKAAGQKIMTPQEAKAWKRNYNNINNEGGEGYIPQVVTTEDIKWAKEILK